MKDYIIVCSVVLFFFCALVICSLACIESYLKNIDTHLENIDTYLENIDKFLEDFRSYIFEIEDKEQNDNE